MLAPLKWLKDYVEIDVPAEELVDKMVMIGNGVEGFEDLGANMKNVVTGRIVKLEKHPDADKLQICRMDVGGEELLQIVTGADNVFEGALVPVALSGSLLPNGVKIKKGKLRGVESNGMLCSGEELCLKEADYPGAEVNGILILQEDFPAGTDMRQVLMQEDTVIEFEVGANRPDCLSILGIAREAAAALDVGINLPEPAFAEQGGDISDYVAVEVQAPDLCPRYMARAVRNVKIAPSPRWMQERLRAAGMRPINNIVDITNFVMLETGQPMHAFDAEDIRGGKIIVRRAQDGERMKTLDGKEREFTSSMLLIADAEGPIGVAGVMGGLDSEIKPDTTAVVFESAKFGYGNIRQTSRGLGIATESSMRYSKGVDSANAEYAINRACQLVELLEAGENVAGAVDILHDDLSEKTVTLTAADVNAKLGTALSAMEMKRCLERVSIETQVESTTLSCRIPRFRGDIDGKADIAEEVARIYGYDNIPASEVTGRRMTLPGLNRQAITDALKLYINATGFYECITYSFVGQAAFDKLLLPQDDALRRAVRIRNPRGDDSAYMRTTLIPSLLEVMATNQKRKNKNIRIYEIGRVYLPSELPLTEELPDERLKLCMAISGAGCDFFSLKEEMENIFEVMHVEAEFDVVTGGPEYFHPGRKALLYVGDALVGQIGEIHPDVQANFGIPERTYVAHMDMESMMALVGTKLRFRPLPKFPAAERDIAVTVDQRAESGSIRKAILKNGGKYIESCELFDVYEGEKLGKGKKSLAYSITFRSNEGTLTDETVQGDMERILDMLRRDYDAALRE